MPSVEMDPLSQWYDYLWSMVEQSPLVTNIVRLKNRVKFNDPSWSSPEKFEVSDADLPELVLVVTQMTGALRMNSSAQSITVKSEWWLSTGDVNVTRGILPLMWSLFAALSNWPNNNANLTWRGKTFVKKVDLVDGTAGLTDTEKNRGIRGFTAIWACEALLVFTTSDVVTAATLKQ